MHVKQCQFSLRDELCIVRGKLGEEIVQVEAPDVQVGRVGIWTQGGLCECGREGEREEGTCTKHIHCTHVKLKLVQNPPPLVVTEL